MKNVSEIWRSGSLGSSSTQSLNPVREIANLQRYVDRLFDNIAAPHLNTSSGAGLEIEEMGTPEYAPSCDAVITDSHCLLSFDIPGVKKEDIKIELKNNELIVSGHRSDEHEEHRRDRMRAEKSYGYFERIFTLPVAVKAELIEANYADGVLRVAIPKNETVKVQQVKVSDAKPGFWNRFIEHKDTKVKAS